jgi:hypothetical protein
VGIEPKKFIDQRLSQAFNSKSYKDVQFSPLVFKRPAGQVHIIQEI